MPIHTDSEIGHNHILHNYEYADATARNAVTTFTSADVDKIAKQLDDGSLWRCISQTGGVPTWQSFGGGLLYFTEAQDTTAPNDTKPVVSLFPSGSDTNIDVAIIPKGNGSFALNAASTSTSGGDKRGQNAVDLQMGRASTTQVASGNTSFAVGASNTASGESSTAIGVSNISDGKYSTVTGFDGRANGIESKVVHSTFTGFQSGQINLLATTSDTTPAVLLSSTGATVNASTQLSIPANSALSFIGSVIAYEDGGSNTSAWKIEGLLYRPTDEASTVLIGSSVTVISNTPSYTLALTANTILGCLTVTFTGINSNNTKVCASILTSEVMV